MGTMRQQTQSIDVQWLGRRRYAEVWELQRCLLEQRIEGAIDDTLLLVEHEPVYTWGKRTAQEHLGAGPEALRALGTDTFEVERGGEVTYHGPGQLVGYPICNLKGLACGRDVHKYMRGLEEVMIRVLATYGITGERVEGMTGVWVEEAAGGRRQATGTTKASNLPPPTSAKIAALGVRVRHWCTMHGFALNVTDECLPWFAHVTPCGITGRGVTSLQSVLGKAPSIDDVRARVVDAFRNVLCAAH